MIVLIFRSYQYTRGKLAVHWLKKSLGYGTHSRIY